VGLIVGDELVELRRFLAALKAGTLTIRENDADVTQRELAKLTPDIESLEDVRTRSRKPRGQA
jgi:hypothetical protein